VDWAFLDPLSSVCLSASQREEDETIRIETTNVPFFEHDELFCLNEKKIKLKWEEMESKEGRNPTPMEHFHGF